MPSSFYQIHLLWRWWFNQNDDRDDETKDYGNTPGVLNRNRTVGYFITLWSRMPSSRNRNRIRVDYMDCIRYTDQQVGEILEKLKEEEVLENTLIILMGDNGVSHARGKQFLYDEGVRIMFSVMGPNVEKGVVREDLIEHIDIGPISLAAAGIGIPPWMQGKDVFSRSYEPQKYVYGARDRCGETIDRIRSVRSDRYKYIWNFYPERPLLQPSNYKDSKEIIKRLRYLYRQGQLTALQEELLFAAQRPAEELYDIVNDPYETVNLAYDNDYREILYELRGQQEKWSGETNDPAPESFEVYSLEMENQ